ncbi:MAG: hypothetical protein LBI66_11320 [Burkholderiaceae bacterium]|jgi:hypothetical protein|nr:hypothetical protein [Burkholderiaceae bacterium]
MNKILASTALVAVLSSPALVQAQFSLPSIPGVGKLMGGSGASASSGDVAGQGDVLVRNYVAASKDVLNANARMASALGLKEQAASAASTADSLGDGATVGNLGDGNKVVSDTSGAIAESMAKKPVLDAAAKATFADGLVHLVNGSVKYAGLGKDVTSMGKGLQAANPMQLTRLGSAAWVVSKFPGSASDLFRTVQTAIAFARENDIEVPANAADATSALGSLSL